MQATAFDASAVLPWEWDQVIAKIRDRPICERDLIVQFILDGGCGYDTGSLLVKLALQLPGNASIADKCTRQPTDANAMTRAIFNQDEDLVDACITNETTRISKKYQRRSKKPMCKTQTRKKLVF
jgi:hypothetical protein